MADGRALPRGSFDAPSSSSDLRSEGSPSRPPGGGRLDQIRRQFLTVFTIVAYALVGPWGYLAFAVMVALPTRDFRRRRARLQATIRWGFGLLFRWVRWVRLFDVRQEALRDAELPPGCVIVANHPTHLDAAVFLGTVVDCCTIAKPLIYRQWWIRSLLAGAGYVPGSVDQPLAIDRLLERLERRLEDGQRVVIFPESTRSEPGAPLRFHRLAFELSCRTGAPLVVARITCTPRWLAKETSLWVPPRQGVPRYEVEVLETIDPDRFDRKSRRLRDGVMSLYTGPTTQRSA